MHLLTSEILDQRQVAPDHWVTTLDAPAIARAVRPGQFVMLRPTEAFDPLLPRAFSVYHADREAGCLAILYRAVGRGTRSLAALEAGRFVSVWGPLGKPFPLPATRHAILVGGGVGVPPLVYLAEELASAPLRRVALIGAATGTLLLGTEFLRRAGAEIRLATDDGSLGHAGYVTDLLPAALREAEEATVYACGPIPMLAATARICREAGARAYLAVEAPMACGVGACLGCTVPRADGGFARVCVEGPVFTADQLDWAALTQP